MHFFEWYAFLDTQRNVLSLKEISFKIFSEVKTFFVYVCGKIEVEEKVIRMMLLNIYNNDITGRNHIHCKTARLIFIVKQPK